MKGLLFVLAHLLTTLASLLGPGGSRAIVADSLLLKQQLLIINRSGKRAPNLTATDRILLGFWSLFLSPRRIRRSSVIIKSSTLLRFHEALKKRKYRLLYSSRRRGKPGPKGSSEQLILVIVEMKRRNPRYGCPKIAEQISKLFGIEIDKDIVRRVLAKHYHPDTDGGPSWLTFIGHMKDSLWSIDLFRCESILFKTHCVLVVMDQFSRRTPRALPTGASLALACMLVMWTVSPCAACSTVQFLLWVCRDTSALTTIHFSNITDGKPISEFLRLTRSNPFPIHRPLILL